MRRLPLWGKLAYGAGSAGWSMIDRIVITWLMYYYVSGRGGDSPLLMPAVFGGIMLFGRIVDALADPLVALWSDNFGGKKGRRIPFLAVGGILYVLVFIALFFPPVSYQSFWNVLYLIVMSGLYFILFTVYVCPYLALLPELARSNRDRVDLSTLKALFTLVGVAVAMVGSGILIGAFGFSGMVFLMSLLALLFLYLPVLIREREYAESRPATLGLFKAVAATFKNRAFRIYLGGYVTFWFGFNIITLGVPFYVTALLGLDEGATALYFAAIFGVAVVAFPLVNILSKRWGLKKMMIISMIMFIVNLPFIYFIGGSFFGLSAEHFALLVLGLGGLPLAGLLIIPDAIVAALSDLEENISGERREAMYFGTQGFIIKVAMGLSTLVTGLLLQFFGQDPGQALGIQLTGPVAAAFIFLGLLFFFRYPEQEVNAVQYPEINRGQ
jgi:glycoside/pentoside/hexuronide:cation symporter, GPH family